ncbi:MAG TPA: hypothetical protein PLO24_06610 [Bacteroidales bacterium]|jgi:hypothetical protein|nr:hypothetical protein [Bacteroidales bacterium]HOS71993.1 hypothetical protein [Bacteroidales bacterium]HQH23008.1 hypothetical protein [Bacteroidales bacterium]HQJ82171.1 hypothetical protein [Bacteroidales bacterium]
MKRLFFTCLTAAAIILASCGGGTTQKEGATQKTGSTDEKKVQTEAKANYLDREVLEAKLKEIGFPIYPGAEFEKIEKGSGYFKGAYIQYEIPEVSSESKEAVDKFYKEVFEKLEASGWKNVFDVYWEKRDMLLHFAHVYNDFQAETHFLGITFGLSSEQ